MSYLSPLRLAPNLVSVHFIFVFHVVIRVHSPRRLGPPCRYFLRETPSVLVSIRVLQKAKDEH